MHIVILAWIYVTFAMALTMNSLVAGASLFAFVGLGPVALWAFLRLRRVRARREREPRAGEQGPPVG